MPAPHFKSASNNVMLVWDDTAKDFVVWDGVVSGGSGFDTVWLKNVAGTKINPATSDNQTSGGQKTQVVNSSGVNEDFATETTLQGLAVPTGQDVSASSIPVVLSTEQENIIDAIAKETTLANVDSTLSSMDLTVNDINTAIGEVSATPTTNTVLDRLKAIKTSVDSATPAGSNLIGKVGIDQTTDGTTNKVAATQSTHDNLNGNANIQVANTDVSTSNPVPVKSMPPDTDVTTNTNAVRKYYTSTGAATDGIVWSPAAGKRWHITSLYFQVSADATVTFEDDKAAGDDPVLKGEFKAGSGLSLTFDKNYPMASGEDAADLLVTTSAGNIYITIVGFEV